MTTNFNLTSGKNRALVFYCDCEEGDVYYVIKGVFDNAGIEIDEQSGVFSAVYPESKTALNIALKSNYLELDKIGAFERGFKNFERNLKVGGSFSDVCVGVFFYDQPVPPPEPEPDPDDPTELEEEDEPVPPPSITSLVCDALRDTFGGIYGASAFVVPATITEFTLEVE